MTNDIVNTLPAGGNPLTLVADLKIAADNAGSEQPLPKEIWAANQVSIAVADIAALRLSPQERLKNFQKLSGECGHPVSAIAKEYKEITKQCTSEPAPAKPADAQSEIPPEKLEQVQELSLALANEPDIFPCFKQDLSTLGYVASDKLAGSVLISHGAILLSRSMGFVFHGSSGAGKTDLILQGAKLLPPEKVLTITATSENAAYYFGDIKHRYLILGEVKPLKDGQDDPKQMAWRQLISENRITRQVVERTDGRSNTGVMKVTEGPCVIVCATTTEPGDWIDEFTNRNSWIRADDSKEVTDAVTRIQAERAEKPWLNNNEQTQLLMWKWQNYYRSLEQLPVSIPFAQQIRPVNAHVTARRLFALVLDYTRASALLHQHTRQTIYQDNVRHVIATWDDYRKAYALLQDNAPRVLEICSAPSLKAYAAIKESINSRKSSLSTGEIRKLLGQPPSTVAKWINELRGAGLLTVPGKEGKQNLYALGVSVDYRQDIGLIPPPGKFSSSQSVSIDSETVKHPASDVYTSTSQLLTEVGEEGEI